MIINHGGYANSSKEKAREEIENLKEKNKQELFVRKQKIKHLSDQTNNLRRKLEEKKQQNEDEEEKRRNRILKMRKLKIDAATENFQRTPDKKARDNYNKKVKQTNQVSDDVLKDGTYNVAGHVVEIRNGIRVAIPSEKTRHQSGTTPQQQLATNNATTYRDNNFKKTKSTFQQSVYEPTFYLNSHLNNLLGNVQERSFPNYSTNNVNNSDNTIEQYNQPQSDCDQQMQYFLRYRETTATENTSPSPADSLCSNDSLNNIDNEDKNMESSSSSHWQQRTLRSSLKGSSPGKMTECMSRKVTFSSSIEFNDGDTRPIFTPPTVSVPLYKRMELNNSGLSEKSQEMFSTTQNNCQMDDGLTIERLLDQLRQESLLPRYPHNEDFSYPDSVDISHPSTVAAVSPLAPDQFKNNETTDLTNTQQKQSLSTVRSTTPDNQSIEDGEQQLIDSLNSISVKDSIEVTNNNKNNINNKRSYYTGGSEVSENNSNENTRKNGSNIPINPDTESIHTTFVYPVHTTTSDDKNPSVIPLPASNANNNGAFINNSYTVDTDETPAAILTTSGQIQQKHKSPTIYTNSTSALDSSQPEARVCNSSKPSTPVIIKTVSLTFANNSKRSNSKTPAAVVAVASSPCSSTSTHRTSTNTNTYATKQMIRSRGTDDKTNKDINQVNAYSSQNNSVSSITNRTKPTKIVNENRDDPIDKIKNNTTNYHKDNADVTRNYDVTPSSTHFRFSDSDYDRWESQKKRDSQNNNGTNEICDIYKNIEQSMASITFQSHPDTGDSMKDGNKTHIQRPANNPKRNVFVENDNNSWTHLNLEKEIIAQPLDTAESERISSVAKGRTAIPVRVHSSDVRRGHPSNVRRGRVIVSANSKKRKQQLQHQNGNAQFAPHPPPPKTNGAKMPLDNAQTSNKQYARSKQQQQQRKRMSAVEKVYLNNNNNSICNNSQQRIDSNSSRLNSAPGNRDASSKPNSSSRASTATNSRTSNMNDVNHPISANEILGNPLNDYRLYVNEKNDRIYNNIIDPHTVPHRKPPLVAYRLPLDKTPTDDDINTLWANVRDCLSTEIPEHAFSDSVCVVEPRKQHQRSSSGTSFHRRTNSGNVRQMSKTHPNRPSINYHRRFGSQELIFHRENSYDSINSASSFSRRKALLPQRVSRVLSPSVHSGHSGSDGSAHKKQMQRVADNPHRNNVGKEENSGVSASMATFLALEELCTQQSLTPRQAEAVFKASKSLMRKQKNPESKPDQGISAISLEEKRVMESLERINRKLRDQEEVVDKTLTPRNGKDK